MYSFRSFRSLKLNLGRLDATIEITELALRSFLACAEEHGSTGAFVEESSRAHGVCVSVSDLSDIHSRVRLSYLVTVHEAADLFFREFETEHSRIHDRPWPSRPDNVAQLTHVIENLGPAPGETCSRLGRARLELFDYYRRVRNQTVHPSAGSKRDPYDRLRKYMDEIHAIYPSLASSPHPFALVDFDDFVLFSRLTKDIAADLCRIATPSSDVVTAFARTMALAGIDRHRGLSNNVPRLRRVIANELRFELGIDADTAESIVCDVVAR